MGVGGIWQAKVKRDWESLGLQELANALPPSEYHRKIVYAKAIRSMKEWAKDRAIQQGGEITAFTDQDADRMGVRCGDVGAGHRRLRGSDPDS